MGSPYAPPRRLVVSGPFNFDAAKVDWDVLYGSIALATGVRVRLASSTVRFVAEAPVASTVEFDILESPKSATMEYYDNTDLAPNEVLAREMLLAALRRTRSPRLHTLAY